MPKSKQEKREREERDEKDVVCVAAWNGVWWVGLRLCLRCAIHVAGLFLSCGWLFVRYRKRIRRDKRVQDGEEREEKGEREVTPLRLLCPDLNEALAFLASPLLAWADLTRVRPYQPAAFHYQRVRQTCAYGSGVGGGEEIGEDENEKKKGRKKSERVGEARRRKRVGEWAAQLGVC